MTFHDPGTSRRRVLQGAAWSAPAIILATAAPAFAASGRASVTTTVRPAVAADGKLPVTLDFLNRNTESTGLTTVIAKFTPTPGFGTVVKGVATAVTADWRYLGSGGTNAEPTFSFSRTAGIDGAATSTGTATTTLSFTVDLVPNAGGLSAGTISVIIIPTSGSTAGGSGAWA